MAREIEIKLPIKDESQLDNLLKICQSKVKITQPEVIQRDEYFDTSDGLLRSEDLTVRLRSVNDIIKLAVKSPRVFIDDKTHSRVEIEFTVPEERDVRKEIANHNLIANTIIEKLRQSFHFDDVFVAIDTLPFIGKFVEIEATCSRFICDTMTLLGLNKDNAVRENYTELLKAHFSRIGLPTKPSLIATFEAENEFKKKDSKTC